MHPTSLQMKLSGLLGLATGTLIALVVTLSPADLQAPRWVAYLAAAAFFLAGASALARAYERPYLAHVCVCLILGTMLVISLWIALGPGPRVCVGGLPGLGFTTSDASCRLAFGLGSMVVGAMLLLAVRSLAQCRATG